MASYTDLIPLGLKAGDVITLNTGGTYVIPTHLELRAQVCAAPAGQGQSIMYAVSEGGHSTVGTILGGVGGAGGMVAFQRTFEPGQALKVELGAVGAPWFLYALAKGETYLGKTGVTGGASKISIDGTPFASATGGTGGTGANVSMSSAGTCLVYAYTGTKGKNGAADLLPSGGTAGVSPYSAACVVLTVISANAAPSDPKNIQYGSLHAARSVDVSWTAANDPEGDALTYALEYHSDGGVYSTVATTSDTLATVTIPAEGSTGQFRVKAVDARGAESAYATGSAKPIIYNFDPVISGSDADMGEVSKPFDYPFSVDDPDPGDILRLTAKLDGATVIDVQNATRNQPYKISLAMMEEIWQTLPAGNHTITVEAYDDNGGSALRTVRFQRLCKKLEIETIDGILSDDLVKTVMLYFSFKVPDDASVLLQLRNDPAAPWENVTEFNASKSIYAFANETKTVSGKARLDARAVFTKGQSGGEIVFYGATLLLDANGDSTQNWASQVLLKPSDIAPGGCLTPSDSNVMRALNTVSVKAQAAGLRMLGKYATLAALKAAHPTGNVGDLYAVASGTATTAYLWDGASNAWVETPGIAGVQGAPGEPGAKGETGAKGDAGPKGEKGDPAVIELSVKTYAELKALKDAGKLVPGLRYVVSDYATKYQQPYSGKIVTCAVEALTLTAEANNRFAPTAWSASYPNDIITYSFDESKCEDNATARNGFILRRVDPTRNIDLAHDWRAMKWARFKADTSAIPAWESGTVTKGNFYLTGTSISKALRSGTPSGATDGSYFVEAVTDYANNYILYDTAYGLNRSSDYAEFFTFDFNGTNDHARTTITNVVVSGNAEAYRSLGNNVWRYTSAGERPRAVFAATRFENNTFGSNSYNNTFASGCYGNVAGSGFRHVRLDCSCYQNIFANDCYGNAFASNCYGNVFGTNCRYNTFACSAYGNVFGNNCYNNMLGSSSYNNAFGSGCYGISLLTCCYNNVLGSNSYNDTLYGCYNLTIGNEFRYNEVKERVNGKDFSGISELNNKTYNHSVALNAGGKTVVSWLDASNAMQYLIV